VVGQGQNWGRSAKGKKKKNISEHYFRLTEAIGDNHKAKELYGITVL
jgi:hypothetical protein